jgi:hypothetical protein
MPLSKSVLRKYTPPTCTLEIKAKESLLSRWAGRTALQDLNFKLSFDDPRQPDEQQVTVWGDRAQLEALSDAVETYIQNFLEQPPEKNILSANSKIVVDTPPSAKLTNGKGNAPATLLPEVVALPEGAAEAQPQDRSIPIPSLSPLLQPQQLSPYLEPAGLVSHKLFLGSLQTRESGPVVNLTALQLFDLAQALEEYSSEMVVLPPLSGDRTSKLPPVPMWGYATAAGVVAAVGLATQIQPMMKLLNPSNTAQTTAQVPQPTATEPAAAPLADDILPENSSASTSAFPPANPPGLSIPGGVSSSSLPSTPGATSAFPTSPGTISSLPYPATGTSGFPANPGTISSLPPTARSTSPVPATPGGRVRLPSPSTGNPSGLFSPGTTFQIPSSPQERLTLGNNNNPRSPTSPARTSPPKSRQQSPSTVGKARNNRTTLPNVALAPGVYTPDSIFSASDPFPLSAQLPSEEEPKKSPSTNRGQANQQRQVARNSKPAATAPTPAPSPLTPTVLEPQLNPSAPPLNLPPIDEQEASLPANLRPVNPTTDLPQIIPSPVTPSATSLEVPKSSPGQAALLTPPSGGGFTLPPPNPASGDTAYRSQPQERLFDRIPQVTEVRNYFEQRWKPPTDLPQSKLEYTLVINSSGSVDRIVPLTSAAGNYIERTGMPKPGGEQLVSPLTGEGNAKIRVVLYKDGQVETLLEP